MFRSILSKNGPGLRRFASSVEAASARFTPPNDFGLPTLSNYDLFAVPTSANYTQTQDSGSPTWAQDYVTSEMGAVSAATTQAILRRNTFSQANASVQVATHRSEDSGIVVRFLDQSNFYLLALSDDSGTNPTANLRLFKRVAGTFTQLGSSVNVAWTRGTTKTFRLTANGTSITAYMDGVSQIAVTDSGIAAAGAIGMRANSTAGNDSFEALSWG